MKQWKVVGGGDKGGILVREGQALSSAATKERLATGSIVDQVELIEERLHYRVAEGSGPREGWVSLRVSGKELLVPHEPARPAAPKPPAEVGGPGTTSARSPLHGQGGPNTRTVEQQGVSDAGLRRRLETEARVKRKGDDFARYCLKYATLGFPLPECKLRVLCFHSAGAAESTYTSPGTPLLEWVKEVKNVEIVALDFPGRNKLLQARRHTSIETLAPELLSVVHDKLTDGVPYVVWAHSVGTWVAFEILQMVRKAGLPMPLAALLMAFPGPQMAEEERPWRRSGQLDDEELREELRGWDREHFEGPGRTAFEIGWEGTWEPMLRADFKLFDEYKFGHGQAARFDFPIHAWHFERDQRIQPDMVKMWSHWTSKASAFDHRVMEGMGHLTCFYRKDLKRRYFEEVVKLLRGYAGEAAAAPA